MVVENSSEVTINITIQSLIDAHLIYAGRSSGKQYEWMRAGDTCQVLEQDVPELLQKRLGRKLCCGNGENKIFQIV